jgi:hypothetical protein
MLEQFPDDEENPMQVNTPSVLPITKPATAMPTTPR